MFDQCYYVLLPRGEYQHTKTEINQIGFFCTDENPEEGFLRFFRKEIAERVSKNFGKISNYLNHVDKSIGLQYDLQVVHRCPDVASNKVMILGKHWLQVKDKQSEQNLHFPEILRFKNLGPKRRPIKTSY